MSIIKFQLQHDQALTNVVLYTLNQVLQCKKIMNKMSHPLVNVWLFVDYLVLLLFNPFKDILIIQEFDEDEVFKFLTTFYSPNNIVYEEEDAELKRPDDEL